MSKQIDLKRNETCVVGLPRCDYVFSSNRSCFIAYGFNESQLETEILRGILESQNIEVFEAGGDITPGKNAFCTKICSKIITSQFCVILLNEDEKNGTKMPNANVNMEYGLMLGFNKYIIPFQREADSLPFNVAGLDTIKYNQTNFKAKAEKAIKQAITETTPDYKTDQIADDRVIQAFLLNKNTLIVPLDDLGEKNLYELGKPFGYNLLTAFSGSKYYYLGIFNQLSDAQIKWRINKLEQVLEARLSTQTLAQKIRFGVIDQDQAIAALQISKFIAIWIIVQTDEDKDRILEHIEIKKFKYKIFSMTEIRDSIKEEDLL